MVAINRLHSDNLITTDFDEKLFRYNFSERKWLKINSTLYKYNNTNIDSLDANNYNVNDFIALYKEHKNHLLFSENPNDELWKKDNFSIETQRSSITCPALKTSFYLSTSYNKKNEITDHKLEQVFYTKMNDYVILSTYVKEVNNNYTSKFSLTAFCDTYSIGLSAKFDLTDFLDPAVGEISITPNVIDRNYELDNEQIRRFRNIFGNPQAKIKKYSSSTGIYYRIWLMYKANAYTQVNFAFNILDELNNYVFDSSLTKNKFKIYVGGFQVDLNDYESIQPNKYLYTIDESKYVRELTKLYIVSETEDVKHFFNYDHNLYYLTNIQEQVIYNEATSSYNTILKPESLPPIEFYNLDIAVSPSIISFTNTSKVEDEDDSNIMVDKTNYTYVKLGDTLVENAPDNVLFYDSESKEYKIKIDDILYPFKSNKEIKTLLNLVRSMTYNQGHFETWSQQGSFLHQHGYNTGGGCNFYKINLLGHKTRIPN